MWLQCRSWSSAENRVLPWDGGWLDWDLYESKAFHWIDQLVDEIKAENELLEERRKNASKAAEGFYGNR